MYKMFIDDERNPVGKYDIICRTPDEAIKAIRKQYKLGERHYFLEMDHDSGNKDQGDFINVLKNIESYVRLGKMSDLDIDIHFHSGNSVGINNMRQIVMHNDYMYEVR